MEINQKTNRITACFLSQAAAGSLRSGHISDDTQMAMFTAEGLILSQVRSYPENAELPTQAVFHALLRWLYTQQASLLQGMVKSFGSCSIVDGMLMGHKALFNHRDPSGTCLETLQTGTMGSLEYPPGKSRGPGALARNIPIGLSYDSPEAAFKNGIACAVLTHGHPEAYLSAGYLSCLISQLVCGIHLETAVESSIDLLKMQKQHEAILETIYEAKHLSMQMRPEILSVTEYFPERTACHVLGSALFYILAFGKNMSKTIDLALKTAPSGEAVEITAAILGAIHGKTVLPDHVISRIELIDVIGELAEDLISHFHEK